MEVSCRNVLVVCEAAERRGVAREALLRGTDFAPAHLRDRRARVSWTPYTVFLENARAQLGEDALDEIGAEFVHSPLIRSFSIVARLMFDTRAFYRWMNRPRSGGGNQLVTCITPLHEEPAPDHIRLTLRMAPGYASSRPFFVISKGTMRAMPAIVGAPPSKVDMVVDEAGATYDIRYREGCGLRGRLARRHRLRADARAAAEELAAYDVHQTDAEVAQAARERVLAGLHHDMRAPLQLILISAAALRDGARIDPGEREKHLRRVAHNVQRLVGLIDGMRAPAPAPDPAADAAADPGTGQADVTALALACVDAFQPAAREAGISLVGDGPPALVAVLDARRIERALANLVSNALKFTRAGGGIVVTWARREDGRVEIQVRDDGVGVDDATKARLFHAAVTPGAPARGGPIGTGIGLTIVAEVARAHGGSVHVEDAPGGGAVFRLLLPGLPSPRSGD